MGEFERELMKQRRGFNDETKCYRTVIMYSLEYRECEEGEEADEDGDYPKWAADLMS